MHRCMVSRTASKGLSTEQRSLGLLPHVLLLEVLNFFGE
jgi:hypothetical protein